MHSTATSSIRARSRQTGLHLDPWPQAGPEGAWLEGASSSTWSSWGPAERAAAAQWDAAPFRSWELSGTAG